MNILSIQSWVSYGHVGNASAVFPLQRLGAEVWAVNTVQFSNHTGYGDWTGDGFTGAQIARVIEGPAPRVKHQTPPPVYCGAPVIGDDDPHVYVPPGTPELMRDRPLPQADIITP